MLKDTDTSIAKIRMHLEEWKKWKNARSPIPFLGFGSVHVNALMDALDEAQAERDEARELHATICGKYADACVRLHRISNIIAGYQSAHSKDNVEIGPDKEAVEMNGKYVGTVPSALSNVEALDTRYRTDMQDAGRGNLLR